MFRFQFMLHNVNKSSAAANSMEQIMIVKLENESTYRPMHYELANVPSRAELDVFLLAEREHFQ